MGRKFIALIISLSVFELSVAYGQGSHRSGGSHGKVQVERGRLQVPHERIFQLSPEDRQRFNRNAERWMQMNAEERKIMRDRERVRQERVKQDAEAALRESGLRLDANQRAHFEARYVEERTKIEHTMSRELETKRREELPALVGRLKKEFQAREITPSPTPPN